MTGQERAALVARWLQLMREVLPGMAAHHRWPVRLDHCFMRICLDAVVGGPWHEVIDRPAIRHATPGQLAAAIAVAERMVADPDLLPVLNSASLAGRRRASAR